MGSPSASASIELQAEDYQAKYNKLLEESQDSQKTLMDQLHRQTKEIDGLCLVNKVVRSEYIKIKTGRYVTGTEAEALAIILDGSTERNSAATSSQVSHPVVLNAYASEVTQSKALKPVESSKLAASILAPDSRTMSSPSASASIELQAEDYQAKYYKLLEKSYDSQKKFIDQLRKQTKEIDRICLENKMLRSEYIKIKSGRAVTGTEASVIILDGSTERNSAATSSRVSPTVMFNANASKVTQTKALKTVESSKPAEPIIAPVPDPQHAVVTAATVETTVNKNVQEIYYMNPKKVVKPANTDPLSTKLEHFNEQVDEQALDNFNSSPDSG